MPKKVKIYTPDGFLKNRQGLDFEIEIAKKDKFQDIFQKIQEETGCQMNDYYLLCRGYVMKDTDKVNADVLRGFANHPHFSLYKRNAVLEPDVAYIDTLYNLIRKRYNDPDNMEHQVALRKLGCIMGMYTGDALGAAYEFRAVKKPADVIGKIGQLRVSEQKKRFESAEEVAQAYTNKYPGKENPYVNNEYMEKEFNQRAMYSSDPMEKPNRDILPMQGGAGGATKIYNKLDADICIGYESKWNTEAGSHTDDSSMGACVLDWLEEKLIALGLGEKDAEIDEAAVCQLFEDLAADLKTDRLADKLLDWMYTGVNSGLWAARARTGFNIAIIGCGATINGGLRIWDKYRFAEGKRPAPATLLGSGAVNDGNGSCIRVAPVPVFAATAKEAFAIAGIQAKATANGQDAALVAALVSVMAFKCIHRPLTIPADVFLRELLSDAFFKEFLGIAEELGVAVSDNMLKLLGQKEISSKNEDDEAYLKWDRKPADYQLHHRKDPGYYGSYAMELMALIMHNLHNIQENFKNVDEVTYTVKQNLLASLGTLSTSNIPDLIVNASKMNIFQAGLETTVLECGDADSTAAVMGTILGALYGFNNIPALWLEKIMYRPLNDDPAKTPFSTAVNFVSLTNKRQKIRGNHLERSLEIPVEEMQEIPPKDVIPALQPRKLPSSRLLSLPWKHQGFNENLQAIVKTANGTEFHFPAGSKEQLEHSLKMLMEGYPQEIQALFNASIELRQGKDCDILLFRNSTGKMIPGTNSYTPGCYAGTGLHNGINCLNADFRDHLLTLLGLEGIPAPLVLKGEGSQGNCIYVHPDLYTREIQKYDTISTGFFQHLLTTLNPANIKYAMELNRDKFVSTGWGLGWFESNKERILYTSLLGDVGQSQSSEPLVQFFLNTKGADKDLAFKLKVLLINTLAEMYGVKFENVSDEKALVDRFIQEVKFWQEQQAPGVKFGQGAG